MAVNSTLQAVDSWPFSGRVREALRCPRCKGTLSGTSHPLRCDSCTVEYPVVHGVPVLLNSAESVAGATAWPEGAAEPELSFAARCKRWIRAALPEISANTAARKNLELFIRVLAASPAKLVLVIGGATMGVGVNALASEPTIELVETDVRPGPRTKLACDAEHLPFADGAFDGAIVQAVLHLLPEPGTCAAEIRRVLRPDGVVYSEMPFMQPAHGGRFDFSRRTLLGHRRLYRGFSEIASGACNGPGTALAFSLRYFGLSFVTSPWAANAVKGATMCTLFWLKYFDYLLASRPGSIDGAAGTYFLGRKSAAEADDAELVAGYKGAVRLDGVE